MPSTAVWGSIRVSDDEEIAVLALGSLCDIRQASQEEGPLTGIARISNVLVYSHHPPSDIPKRLLDLEEEDSAADCLLPLRLRGVRGAKDLKLLSLGCQ